MGDLHWRKKGTRLGCRRGWVGILGLAAFVLVGYFALYGWCRAIKVIEISGIISRGSDETCYFAVSRFTQVIKVGRDGSQTIRRKGFLVGRDWPRESLPFTIMYPAVKLEVALCRRGWLPSDHIRKIRL